MKKKTKKIQLMMILIGTLLVGMSWLIFKYNGNLFLKSLQPEFGSAGIILLIIGGVWFLTKTKINT